jgi:ubiquinol-cytochrome c reductase cytochrome c subunit
VLLLGLLISGSLYTALAPAQANNQASETDQIAQGKELFLASCAFCHGKNGEGVPTVRDGYQIGPSLVGVGAAAVDFQVGTGRMPMAAPGVQAPRTERVKFTDEEIAAMAAYVASLAPGPAVPDEEYASGEGGDVANGGELFRVNCAMCHNFAGSGGALTRGKYAPSLRDIEGKHIYEAMATGPQSMPVFNDANISPEGKRDIIAFLHSIDKQENPGGMALGNLGPVSEGLFIWVFGLGIMIGFAVWLGQKSA